MSCGDDVVHHRAGAGVGRKSGTAGDQGLKVRDRRRHQTRVDAPETAIGKEWVGRVGVARARRRNGEEVDHGIDRNHVRREQVGQNACALPVDVGREHKHQRLVGRHLVAGKRRRQIRRQRAPTGEFRIGRRAVGRHHESEAAARGIGQRHRRFSGFDENRQRAVGIAPERNSRRERYDFVRDSVANVLFIPKRLA